MKKGLLGVLAGAALLSGCVAVEVAHLVMHATEEGVSIKYFPSVDTRIELKPALDVVTPLAYRRHFLRAEGKCRFDGIVVPWERTWSMPAQTIDGDNVRMLPPEPGKVAGYAGIIYRRTCPDAAPESILHVGLQGTDYFGNYVWPANSVGAQDVLDTPLSNRPQWLPQVVQRLAELAPTDAAARRAMTEAQDKLVLAVPELESLIRSPVQ